MEIWMRITILPVISLFLFVGLFIGVDTWQFRNNSAAGTAEIISLRAEQNSTSSSDGPSRDFVTHYPTVRFVTDHGMEYEMETTGFRSAILSTETGYRFALNMAPGGIGFLLARSLFSAWSFLYARCF